MPSSKMRFLLHLFLQSILICYWSINAKAFLKVNRGAYSPYLSDEFSGRYFVAALPKYNWLNQEGPTELNHLYLLSQKYVLKTLLPNDLKITYPYSQSRSYKIMVYWESGQYSTPYTRQSIKGQKSKQAKRRPSQRNVKRSSVPDPVSIKDVSGS